LRDPDHVFKEAPLTAEVAHAMLQAPRDGVPDIPDRIVVGDGCAFI